MSLPGGEVNCVTLHLVRYIHCDSFGTRPKKMRISQRLFIRFWTCIYDYWIQHVNRMPRNRLPKVMKRNSPTGRRNHGRPLKRLLDTWDRTGQQVAQLHDRYRIYNSFTIKLCSHGWYIWQIFVTLGNLPCLFLTDCQEMWNQSRELPLFVCISIQDLFFAFPWLIYTW